MISQQENLLNTQQQPQKSQSQPEAHTGSENHRKKHDHSLLPQSHTSFLEPASENEDLQNESLNSSLAGNADMTGVTGDMEGVRGDDVKEEIVMGEGREAVESDSDVIKPQPSLPFHVVPNGIYNVHVHEQIYMTCTCICTCRLCSICKGGRP